MSQGFRALHNRNYRLFWIAQIISLSGSWMQTTAQAWLVLQITGSPLSLGTVLTLQYLPVTLLALYGGVLADRLPKRTTLMSTQAALMVQAVVFGALVASGKIELGHIYVLAAIQGLISALDTPIRQSFIMEMVGRDDLLNAVALNSMSFNTARILGPSLAGLIIDLIDIAPTLILNAISFIPVLIALSRMDVAALHTAPPAHRGSANQQLREGLSYAWHSPAILSILIAIAFIGTFGFNFVITLPLLARFVLHTNATGFGSLTSFLGIGSLCAALFTAYQRDVTMRRMLIGAGAFSLLLGALALSEVYVLSAALLVAVGFAGIIYGTASNTLLQLASPDDLRGRLMSVHVLLFLGSTPVGGLLIGVLSDIAGVQAALVICAALCLLGVGIAVIYYRQPHPASIAHNTPRSTRPD